MYKLVKIGTCLSEALCSKVLPNEVARERLRESGLRRAYSDPSLRQRSVYLALMRRLAACGLVEFRLAVREKVGVFAVHKKILKIL